MAEDASTLTPSSPRELREACSSTRARITADVDEIEARLREPIGAVVGMQRVTGSRVAAIVAGAAFGYAALRHLRSPST